MSRRGDWRGLLLGGSALCGVAALGGAGEASAANILPTQGAINLATAGRGALATSTLVGGAVTPGTARFTSNGATASVTLTAARTLIDWTTFEVGAGNTLNFRFTNAVDDVVINRLTTGAINVDAGGAVNGQFNGATGGNIWFLAPNGVFIHGTVTASGVLAGNNTAVANLNLLSDNIATLKGELAAGASLIDLTGVVSASGASIDAAGNIVLDGAVDTGASGDVTLESTGTISQTAGAITATTLGGSSAGGASLTQANLFDTLTGFTNTGGGAVSITDAQTTGLTVSGAMDAGTSNTLTLTTTGPLTLNANLTASGGVVDLESGGAISQPAGLITTGSLKGASVGGASLQGANVFDSLAGFANSGAGPLTITDASVNGMTVTGAVDAGVDNSLTFYVNSGPLALAANVSAANGPLSAGSVSLNSTSIVQTAGVITTGALNAFASAGALTLDKANVFDTVLGAFAPGDVSITDASTGGLTVSGDGVSGLNVTLTTTNGGALNVNSGVTADLLAGTVTLTAAGPITETFGYIAGFNLRGSSVGGANLNSVNNFDNVTGFTNTGVGDVTLTTSSTDGSGLTVSGVVDAGQGNNLNLNNYGVNAPGGVAGPMTLAADIKAAGGTVNLLSNSSIDQTSGGIITGSLTIEADTGAASVISATNAFDSLAFATSGGAGDLSVTDSIPLTVTGPSGIDTPNNVTLTTLNGASLTIDGPIYFGNQIALYSAGAISETANGYLQGAFGTSTLTGSSVGGAQIDQAPNFTIGNQGNSFTYLGPFTNTGVGNVSIYDSYIPGLTVSGAVDAGTSNTLTLTNIGTDGSYPLVISAPLTAAGGTVNLVSGAAITETAGGIITTGTLTGSSFGGADLSQANVFDNLGPFTNTSSGVQSTVSITDAKAMNVTGAVDAGLDDILTLTTTAGGLTLGADLSAATSVYGGTINLVSAGPVNQTAGVITAQGLFGSSVGGASLTDANAVSFLSFSNSASGDLAIASTLDLSVGTVSNPVGSVTLSTSGSLFVGDVSITSGLDLTLTAGGTLSMIGAPAVVRDYTITALTFTGPALSPTFDPVNGRDFTVHALSDLTLGVALTAPRNLTVTSGGLLDTSTVALTANAGSLTLTGATSLYVGATTATGGPTSFSTTGGVIVLNDLVNAGSQTVTITSPGTVTENNQSAYGGPIGTITAGTITGSSVGGVDLSQANQFDTLAGWNESGGGSIVINDARASGMTVTGTVDPVGDITLTSAGALTLSADVTAPGSNVNLNAGGAIDQAAGVLTAGTLNLSASGAVTLTAANQVTNLGSFTNSGTGTFAFTNAGALTLSAFVSNFGGDIDIATTTPGAGITVASSLYTDALHQVSLVSAGPISQTGGSINAGTFTGSSVGGAALGQTNFVSNLGPFTNTGAGNVSFTSAAGGLTVVGDVDAGAGNSLTIDNVVIDLTGPLVLAANLTAAGGSVNLISGDAITQTGGIITTGTLTLSSVLGATLDRSNLFDVLGSSTVGTSVISGGALSLTDAKATGLTVDGGLSGVVVGGDATLTTLKGGPLAINSGLYTGNVSVTSTLTLNASGAISEGPGGGLRATTFAGSSVGGAQLDVANANFFDNLGPFTNTGVGNVSIYDSNIPGLTVSGAVDAGAGNTFTLTNIGSAGSRTLFISAPVTAAGGTVNLVSAADIVETAGGIITTGTLTGSSNGGADLSQANVFDNLGGFTNTSNGLQTTVSITDAKAMNVTGAVDAGVDDTLNLTTTAGGLTLGSDLSAATSVYGGAINLVSAGPITQASGVITTSVLGGSSVGGASMTGANLVGTFSNFANSVSGDVVFNNTQDLTASGITNPVGSIILTSTGALTVSPGSIGNTVLPITSGQDLIFTAGTTLTVTATPSVTRDYAITAQTFGGFALNPAFGPNGRDLTVTGLASIFLTTALTAPRNLAITSTGFLDTSGALMTSTGGSLTLSGSTGLNVGPTLATAGPTSLTTAAGNIVLNDLVNAGSQTVTITSPGTVTENNQSAYGGPIGTITAGTITGSSVGGVDLSQANQFDILAGWNESGGGSIVINDARTTGMTVTGTVDPVGDITLTSAGALTLSADVTAPGSTVTLTAGGAIGQTAGVITAGTLTGTSAGAITLNDANQVATLGGLSNGGSGTIAFTDAIATGLTVSSPITAGAGDIDLTSTAAGAALTLSANLTTDSAHQVSLVSAGTIDQTAGLITTGTLTGSSVGGASLTMANGFGALGPFTNTGAGPVSISNLRVLTVSGDVDAGAGNTLTLTAVPPTICIALCVLGDMTLLANVSAAGGVVNLVADRAIVQSAGVVTTGTLTLFAGTNATLNDANLFDVLGLSQVGASLFLTDAKASGLTVNGGGSGVVASTDVTLTTLNGGPLAVNDLISAGATLTLDASGAISEGASGGISASTLAGTSAGGAQLDVAGANLFGNLGPFTNGGTGAVSIADASGAMTVTGDVDAGAGNALTLINAPNANGLAGPLTLFANLTAAGGSVTLTSAGAINQTGGIITTGTLGGSSVGGAALTASNLFDSLGPFTNTGVGNVLIFDAQTTGLTVTGNVDAGADNLLDLTTTAGPMTLAANLTAAKSVTGGSIALTSAGAISQTGGIITTTSLSSVSNGAQTLTAQNLVDTLAGVSNGGAGDIQFTDAIATGLTITSDVTAGAGNIVLTTSAGPLALAANLTTDASHAVTLNSAGALSQSAGVITTGTLTGSSVGGATLTDANLFASLGPFANAGGGAVSITDASTAGMAVGGAVTAGPDGTLTLTASNGPLTLAANVSAPTAVTGGAVNLVSGGALTQTGGIIDTGTLSLSSAGDVSLARANLIDELTNTSVAGALALTDAKAGGLALNGQGGAVTATGDITLTTTGAGALTLNDTVSSGGTLALLASGAVAEGVNPLLHAVTLTGRSVGGVTLNVAGANDFAVLAGFANTGSGNVVIGFSNQTDASMTVTGAVSTVAGGTIILANYNSAGLATPGALTLSANVVSANGSVVLDSQGAIDQTSGVIRTGALTASAGGGDLRLTDANQFASLTAGLAQGSLFITDAAAGGMTVPATGVVAATGDATLTTLGGGPLTIGGRVIAGGALTLASSGQILETSTGAIQAAGLQGSSVGGAQIAQAGANRFADLGPFTNSGGGAVTFVDSAGALAVTGAVDAGAGDTLTIVNAAVPTLPAGPLVLASNVTAAGGAVNLVSAGSITQTGGIITTGALSGSSVGGASLNRANLFDSLSGFTNTGAGPVLIVDRKTSGLTVSGAVDAGAGNNLGLISGGPLTLSANVSAAGAQVNLTAAGAISQTAGAVTAAVLTGSSVGGATLTGANQVATFRNFANTGSGDITFADTIDLAAYGVSNPAGSIILSSTGALTVSPVINGNPTAPVATGLDLILTAGTALTVDSAAPVVKRDYVITGQTFGGLALNPVFDPVQGRDLTVNGLASFTLTTALTAPRNLKVTSTGVLDTSAASLAANTGTITLFGAQGLIVGGTTANSGATSLASGSGDITLGGVINAAGQTLTLTSAGALTQSAGGSISAGVLQGSAVGAITLGSANHVDALGPLASTGAGGITFVDAQASGLTVNGPVDAGAGASLNLTTTAGAITLAGNLTAAGGQVTLVSASTISQTGGIIDTGVLTSHSNGAALLGQPNLVPTLASFTNGGAGDLTFNDAYASGVTAGLTVGADLNAGAGNLTLISSNPGTPLTLTVNLSTDAAHGVRLVSAGSIVQTSGVITTGDLSGQAVGAITLTAAGNQFDTISGVLDTGGGAVTIVDGKTSGLTLTGAIDPPGNVSLTSAGDLTLQADVVAPGAAVTLTAAGAITQTAGVITSASLSSASNGANLLTGQNQVGALASLTNGGAGDMAFTDAIATGFSIGSNLNAGAGNLSLTSTAPGAALSFGVNLSTDAGHALSLVSAGAVVQTGGVITTGSLSGASAGGASLGGPNRIGTLTGFVNRDNGAIQLANAGSLNVTGTIDNTAGAPGALRDVALLVGGNLSGQGVFDAGQNVILNTQGSAVFASASAGNVVYIRAGGAVLASGGLTAGAAPNAQFIPVFQPLTLFGAAEPALGAGGIDIQGQTVRVAGSLAATAPTGDVRIQATGVDTVTGGAAITIGGSVTAGQDVALDATGGAAAGPASIAIAGAATAGRDVAIRSVTGDVTLGSAMAGDNIVLVAPTGKVSLSGSLVASGNAGAGAAETLFSTLPVAQSGQITLGPQNVYIQAVSFADSGLGNGAILDPGGALIFNLSDPAGVSLADVNPNLGTWIQASALRAPTVSIYETGGGITVGDATIDPAVANLNLYTAGLVRVTGAFAPALDDTVSLTIGSATDPNFTPSEIDVVNDGPTAPNHGSIGLAGGANLRTFSAAALFANSNILFGDQAFIAGNSAITDPTLLRQIDPNRPFPVLTANLSGAVTLAAGDVTLGAGRMIVQQDTAGVEVVNGTGSYITRTLTLDGYAGANPPAIDLFGVLVGTAGPIGGKQAALSSQIRLTQALQLSTDRKLYRFNGCVIGSGADCTSVTFPPLGIQGDPLDQYNPAVSGYGAGDGGALDPFDPRGLNGPPGGRGRNGSFFTVPLLAMWQDGMLSQEDQDIEDPTITGAPNEEIWRRAEDRP